MIRSFPADWHFNFDFFKLFIFSFQLQFEVASGLAQAIAALGSKEQGHPLELLHLRASGRSKMIGSGFGINIEFCQ